MNFADVASWSFDTERLEVRPWRQIDQKALARFLCRSLTPKVGRSLPASWQGGVQPSDVAPWMAQREAEGAMFTVCCPGFGLLGLFMFFAANPDDRADNEVRVGYVLAEEAWGQGFASELLAGFVNLWARRKCKGRLLAGVSRGNRASRRVLEKNGFLHQRDTMALSDSTAGDADVDDILTYELARG